MRRSRRNARWIALIGLLVVFQLAMNLSAGQASGEAARIPSGLLAFSSSRTGNADIFAIHADGTGLIQLTSSPAHESEPSWSPDGAHLVYVAQHSRWMLFTSSQYGEHEEQLTTWSGWSPAWSPNGQWIAYSTGSTISMVSSSGEENQSLAQGRNCGLPSWSPDGQSLVFNMAANGNDDIYILSLTDGGIAQVTDDPAQDFAASWSPDGQRLVFASDRDGDLEICTMRTDGSDLVQLTHNDVVDMLPAWSPDGQWIAYVSETDGNPEIYIISADGARTFRVTDSPGDNLYPAWQPIAGCQ